MDGTSRRSNIGLVIAATAVFAVGVWRVAGPDFQRPFDTDELITLQNYTWAGIEAAGERRLIRRLDDLHQLPAPGLRELGLGVYCSLGRWTEPNNHVIHSLLMNISVAAFRNEIGVRLPALLGASVFILATYWLCFRQLGWRLSAPLVVLLAIACPYLVQFGQEARGYSWMLALQSLLILCLIETARRPASIVWGAAAAVCAIASFMNVVSMSLTWLFPVYAAFFILPPSPEGSDLPVQRSLFRRSLIVQLLAIGAVGFVFLMDRLPYVLSSAGQYGYPLESLSDLQSRSRLTVEYLFPDLAWKVFAITGVLGLAVGSLRGPSRWLALLAGLTLLVSLGYSLASKRFAYERVNGYYLPLFIIGNAGLVEALAAQFTAAWWRRTIGGVGWAASIFLASHSALGSITDRQFAELCLYVQTLPASAEEPSLVVVGKDIPRTVSFYTPTAARDLDELPSDDRPCRLCVLSKTSNGGERGVGLTGIEGRTAWFPKDWPAATACSAVTGESGYDIVETKGNYRAGYPSVTEEGPTLVFWTPDPQRLLVRSEPVLNFLNGYEVRYLPIETRYAAKLEVFGRLKSICFVSNNPYEHAATIACVEAGILRFGGTCSHFIPAKRLPRLADKGGDAR